MNSLTLNPKNLAIICPTKDRPEKVWSLLASIAASTIQPSQIIIADGGHNLKSVVAEFADHLDVTCLHCPELGQIRQRSYAHTHLLPQIKLVLHIDDDITLASDALAQAILHWNQLAKSPGKPVAGLALNVVNHPIKRNNMFRSVALMKVEPQGKVWPSGFSSPHVPTTADALSDWLIGGATIWTRDVLQGHPHPLSFRTRWAFCEDVLFSYPLSKDYRLAVCAAAHVHHNDSYDNHSFEKRIFYAKTQVFMRHLLVSLNDDLSIRAFLWMTMCQMAAYFIKGLLGNLGSVGSFLGTLGALALILRAKLFGQSAEILVRGLVK